MNLHNISSDLFAHFLKKKIIEINNQEERDDVSLQGYLCKIYYAINLHAWNSQIKRLKFNLKAHATRKWNHSVSYISSNEKTLGTKRCRKRGRSKGAVLLCRAGEHPAERDGGEEPAAGHEARHGWQPCSFPAAARAFPEHLKAKLGKQYGSWMERKKDWGLKMITFQK